MRWIVLFTLTFFPDYYQYTPTIVADLIFELQAGPHWVEDNREFNKSEVCNAYPEITGC